MSNGLTVTKTNIKEKKQRKLHRLRPRLLRGKIDIKKKTYTG